MTKKTSPVFSHKKIGMVLGVLLAGWISAVIVATIQPQANTIPPAPSPAPEPWQNYASVEHGIRLSYPPDWIETKTQDPNLVAAFATATTDELIRQGRVNPDYRYRLSLWVWPTIAGHPLAKKFAPDATTLQDFFARVPVVAPQGDLTLDGQAAWSFIANDGHQFYGILIPREGKIYALHFERTWTKARFVADSELTKLLASIKLAPIKQ